MCNECATRYYLCWDEKIHNFKYSIINNSKIIILNDVNYWNEIHSPVLISAIVNKYIIEKDNTEQFIRITAGLIYPIPRYSVSYKSD